MFSIHGLRNASTRTVVIDTSLNFLLPPETSNEIIHPSSEKSQNTKPIVPDYGSYLSKENEENLVELCFSGKETKEEIIKAFAESKPGLDLESIPEEVLPVCPKGNYKGEIFFNIGGSVCNGPDGKEIYKMYLYNNKNKKTYFFIVKFRPFFPALLTSASASASENRFVRPSFE